MESEDGGDKLLDETWQKLISFAGRVDRVFELRQKYRKACQLATEYPLATVCLIVFLAACSVPVLCFIAFAAVSTVITFCGFLFVEGVLLTIAAIILGSCLMIILAISLGFITSTIFTCAVVIGLRHLWASCSSVVKTWLIRCKYQCWEYASYKEIWQSDRTSEPEDLSPEQTALSTNTMKADGGNKAVKKE